MAQFDWRLLVSALASAAPQLAEARASRKARADLERGQAESRLKQAQADRMLGDEIGAFAKSDPAAEALASKVQHAQALQRARAQPGASMPANLGGKDYRADVGAAAGETARYGAQQADFVSKIDAPAFQRERQAQSFARTGSNIAALGQESETAQFLARLRASRQRANPWIALLSKVGGQIGRNYERPRGPPHARIPVDPAERYVDLGPRTNDREIGL